MKIKTAGNYKNTAKKQDLLSKIKSNYPRWKRQHLGNRTGSEETERGQWEDSERTQTLPTPPGRGRGERGSECWEPRQGSQSRRQAGTKSSSGGLNAPASPVGLAWQTSSWTGPLNLLQNVPEWGERPRRPAWSPPDTAAPPSLPVWLCVPAAGLWSPGCEEDYLLSLKSPPSESLGMGVVLGSPDTAPINQKETVSLVKILKLNMMKVPNKPQRQTWKN